MVLRLVGILWQWERRNQEGIASFQVVAGAIEVVAGDVAEDGMEDGSVAGVAEVVVDDLGVGVAVGPPTNLTWLLLAQVRFFTRAKVHVHVLHTHVINNTWWWRCKLCALKCFSFVLSAGKKTTFGDEWMEHRAVLFWYIIVAF